MDREGRPVGDGRDRRARRQERRLDGGGEIGGDHVDVVAVVDGGAGEARARVPPVQHEPPVVGGEGRERRRETAHEAVVERIGQLQVTDNPAASAASAASVSADGTVRLCATPSTDTIGRASVASVVVGITVSVRPWTRIVALTGEAEAGAATRPALRAGARP